MLKVVQENNESNRDEPASEGVSLLDEIVRDGARQMLAAAMQAEVAAFVDAHADHVDESGRRLVVRQPRVNDKRVDEVTGERNRVGVKTMTTSTCGLTGSA